MTTKLLQHMAFSTVKTVSLNPKGRRTSKEIFALKEVWLVKEIWRKSNTIYVIVIIYTYFIKIYSVNFLFCLSGLGCRPSLSIEAVRFTRLSFILWISFQAREWLRNQPSRCLETIIFLYLLLEGRIFLVSQITTVWLCYQLRYRAVFDHQSTRDYNRLQQIVSL